MLYYFIEHDDPINDLDNDLNFDDDTLYNYIDERNYKNIKNGKKTSLESSNLSNQSNRLHNNQNKRKYSSNSKDESDSKSKSKSKKSASKTNYNIILLLFIFITILVIVLCYAYNNIQKEKKYIIDKYNSSPELIMINTDIGRKIKYIVGNSDI